MSTVPGYVSADVMRPSHRRSVALLPPRTGPFGPARAGKGTPMRISVLTHMLHPIRSPYEGGLEMHTAMTVEHLVRRGHDVTVCPPRAPARAARAPACARRPPAGPAR